MANSNGSKNLICDPVPRDSLGCGEIDFFVPEIYNASEVLFHNLKEGRGGKIAIYSEDGQTTFSELCAKACKTGNALKSLGLEDNARILLFLDDTAQYPAVFFGAIRAGFVPVLINTLSTEDLLRFYLQDSGAAVAIYDSIYADLFNDETIRNSSLSLIISVNGDPAAVKGIRTVCWDNWVDGHLTEMDAAPTNRDDMSFWMYSSGSTGRPKGIVHLQHDMLYSVQSFGRHVLKVRENDICFSVPKIFFAYGLGNSTYFPFSVGASVVLYKGRPTPESVFDAIEQYQPTLFFGLPTLYNALLQSERCFTAKLNSVRLCLSAAETLSEEMFKKWQDLFGHEIVEGLGSTEMTHVYLSNRSGCYRVGSAGQRVPGYEIKMTDLDGNLVKKGDEGLLWVRGDSSAPCYWNRPEKTAETMRGSWIWTGDFFTEDEDGFFYFRGRADDLIKVSGQWVYPLEVELCLANHSKLQECAVMGIKGDDNRMVLHGFVVPDSEVQACAALTKELQDYVKAKLVPYKYPRIIHYVDALPKTGTDKIDRQALLRFVQVQD